jgi:threonine dehydrogenase-like Zn-dependent dehydrogenase
LFFDKGISYRVDLPDPAPSAGEALIKILFAGICQTDIEILKGYLNYRGIPGHEFVGEVLSPGPLQGKRVVGEINCSCGSCSLCQAGLSNHCSARTVLGIKGRNGCFADRIVLPSSNLHAVPQGLTDEEALFAEPLAAAFQIPKQIPLSGREHAIVLGDGRLGLLVAQVLRSRCRELLLVGRNPGKLKKAQELGLHAVDGRSEDYSGKADLVVDATGSPEALCEALQWVRPQGAVVLKTTVEKNYSIDMAPVVIKEITIVGSRCGPFPEALEALAKGEVKVAPLLSATYPLSQWKEAFRRATDGESLKVALSIGTSINRKNE